MLPSMHLNEESTPWNIGTPGVGLGNAAGPQRSSLSSQRSSITQLVNPSLGSQQSVGSGTIHLSNNQTSKRTCHSNPVYLLLSDLGRNETTQSTSPSKGIRLVSIGVLLESCVRPEKKFSERKFPMILMASFWCCRIIETEARIPTASERSARRLYLRIRTR